MLDSELQLRKQLSEALTVIARTDFNEKWGTLLPELVQNLQSGDLDKQIAVLESMAAVFSVFRETAIDESNDKLDYCQRCASEPVLKVAEV
jgi:hypothetical protein